MAPDALEQPGQLRRRRGHINQNRISSRRFSLKYFTAHNRREHKRLSLAYGSRKERKYQVSIGPGSHQARDELYCCCIAPMMTWYFSFGICQAVLVINGDHRQMLAPA